jgi:Ca2+-binding RTX toxin-like protein
MAGSDTVFGGGGDDFVAWNDPDGDLVFGDRGEDTLLGGNVAADTIHGGDDNDLIRAFATSPEASTAADQLFGEEGDDVLLGGGANDTIVGGEGNDTMTGNDGADVFVLSAGEAGEDLVTDFDPSEDVVQLVGFDPGFDALAHLSAEAAGTRLDLGGGASVLFLGRVVAEFGAEDFVLVA